MTNSLDATVPAEWCTKVAGTLINPVTLLATDYLNHFNEVIMILGMVADMPDMLPEIETWRPKTYPEHFRAASLDYSQLAAEAYDHVPPAFKVPFEATVRQLNHVLAVTQARLTENLAAGDMAGLAQTSRAGVAAMTSLAAVANSIIAGGAQTMQQEEIDRLLRT